MSFIWKHLDFRTWILRCWGWPSLCTSFICLWCVLIIDYWFGVWFWKVRHVVRVWFYELHGTWSDHIIKGVKQRCMFLWFVMKMSTSLCLSLSRTWSTIEDFDVWNILKPSILVMGESFMIPFYWFAFCCINKMSIYIYIYIYI